MPIVEEPAAATPMSVDPVTGEVHPPVVSDATLAYERGKADARAADAAALQARERDLERERRQTPKRRGGGAVGVLGFIVLLLAIVGGVFLFLSWKNGSPAAGGAALQNQLSDVSRPARDAVADARNATGAAVENAGQALKTSGQKIKQP